MDVCANDPWGDYRATDLGSTGAFEKKKYGRVSKLGTEAIVQLDTSATLGSDTGKGGRAIFRIERRRMARCRYQNGCLFIRGKRRKVWVARWTEDVIQRDGSVHRVLRSEVLGSVSEIATRRAARSLLNRISLLNSGHRRAEGTMTFGSFVAEQFEPGILPTLKNATQKSYHFLLRKHLLPGFRDCRLCDIRRAEIQQHLIDKLKQGFA